jgi:hypothetical protein
MCAVKRALLFGALWLAATAATGAVAWGAVRLAGEQTAEQAVRPMTARQLEALAASSTTGAAATGAVTSTSIDPVTTSIASTTGTGATTTGAANTTTTTVGTSTTAAGAGPVVAARQTPGGTVVVSLQSGRLSLVSATPAAGFFVEVEERGPDEVVVVFEGSEGGEILVRAAVDDDEIAFEIETGEDD